MFQKGDRVYCINEDIVKSFNKRIFVVDSYVSVYYHVPMYDNLILEDKNDEYELFWDDDFILLSEHRRLIIEKIKKRMK